MDAFKERIDRIVARTNILSVRLEKAKGKRIPGDGDGDGIAYESRNRSKKPRGQSLAAAANAAQRRSLAPDERRAMDNAAEHSLKQAFGRVGMLHRAIKAGNGDYKPSDVLDALPFSSAFTGKKGASASGVDAKAMGKRVEFARMYMQNSKNMTNDAPLHPTRQKVLSAILNGEVGFDRKGNLVRVG